MSLDDQLLTKKMSAGESAQRAGSLREAQRGRSGVNRSAGPNDFREDEGGANSLREAVLAEKKKQAKAGGGAGEAIASAAAAPMRQGTSKMLQQAWLNLVDSFGLTIIWVWIHAYFLNPVFGEQFFCKLGDEWADMMPIGGATGMPGMAGAKPPVKIANEIWLAHGCCLGCLFIFIALASMIGLMVGVITNPLEALSSILAGIWGAITGTGK